MMRCWSLDSRARPLFKDLVGKFSGLLERESDYLELSTQTASPPFSPPADLVVTQEQGTAAAENETEI